MFKFELWVLHEGKWHQYFCEDADAVKRHIADNIPFDCVNIYPLNDAFKDFDGGFLG